MGRGPPISTWLRVPRTPSACGRGRGRGAGRKEVLVWNMCLSLSCNNHAPKIPGCLSGVSIFFRMSTDRAAPTLRLIAPRDLFNALASSPLVLSTGAPAHAALGCAQPWPLCREADEADSEPPPTLAAVLCEYDCRTDLYVCPSSDNDIEALGAKDDQDHVAVAALPPALPGGGVAMVGATSIFFLTARRVHGL